jgi:hypothetical protein
MERSIVEHYKKYEVGYRKYHEDKQAKSGNIGQISQINMK